jgi:BirA family biotin operon repressor/biotin-[acetyl-CoA-carboxylase] ligase
MDQTLLRQALKATPVSEFRAFDEIGSTNDEALAWLDAGAADFSMVIADSQSQGRGRFDRKWVSHPGSSLAFTVILRPTDNETARPTSLFAPMCALAVHQALTEATGLAAQIKWPNDVLLERHKFCGILVEADWTGSKLNGIVMGIGINVSAGSLPPQSLFPATWIEQHTPRPVDRFDLLTRTLSALAVWRSQLGSPVFFRVWSERLAFVGEPVRVEQAGRAAIQGTEIGIDTEGNLLLHDASGATITVEVGDVHLRSDE